MRIVITGAAGFIGSNLVHALNAKGYDQLILVDDFTQANKYKHLLGARYIDYFDKDQFYTLFEEGKLGSIDVVFHEGACSDTMEHNGRLMMETNYRCSKRLLDRCIKTGARLIYASSAATYGGGSEFIEKPEFEKPLNIYGYSKLAFDNVVRPLLGNNESQIVGFRYFNVYGPREHHKERMASVAFHHFNQFKKEGGVKLFGEYQSYKAGQQARDFIHVDDVVAVNLWFLDHPDKSGIFNLGTGRAQPFNDVASTVINTFRGMNQEKSLPLTDLVDLSLLEYIPFPEALVGKYQSFTQANLEHLRQSGCDHSFMDVQSGTKKYVQWLLEHAEYD